MSQARGNAASSWPSSSLTAMRPKWLAASSWLHSRGVSSTMRSFTTVGLRPAASTRLASSLGRGRCRQSHLAAELGIAQARIRLQQLEELLDNKWTKPLEP